VIDQVNLDSTFDFGFIVPEDFWLEFQKPVPPPGYNTAQALVAHRGDQVVIGDRARWAQYSPFVERVLFCLKPPVPRGEAPRLPRESAITGHYVTIDVQGREYRIFYEEAGSGIPVVCLHTAGSDGRQYKYILEDTDYQKDLRLIAFDLPWHGRSMPPRGWRSEPYGCDLDWYLGIIRGFIAALELDRPIVMGCSLGGLITLVLASLYGEEFRGICSLEGALGGNPDVPKRNGGWTKHMEVDHSLFLSTWVDGLMAPTSPQDLKDDVLWEYGQSGAGVYQGDGRIGLGLAELAPTLKPARCPLYVFSGDYDYSATPAMSKRAAEQLHGEFIPMKGKGHFPMSEDPVGFKEYLTPVLEKLREQ
jgi:pimeloyl-ACP methyl ester carboxylesterase